MDEFLISLIKSEENFYSLLDKETKGNISPEEKKILLKKKERRMKDLNKILQTMH